LLSHLKKQSRYKILYLNFALLALPFGNDSDKLVENMFEGLGYIDACLSFQDLVQLVRENNVSNSSEAFLKTRKPVFKVTRTDVRRSQH